MKTPTCGVYLITCLPTDQVYVGGSVNIEARFSGHKSALRLNTHGNKTFLKLFSEHGEDAFIFKIVEECQPDRNELEKCEQKWIDAYQDRLINSRLVARNAGPMYPETLARMRENEQQRHNEWVLAWKMSDLKKKKADAREVLVALKNTNYSKETILEILEEVFAIK